MGAFIYPFTDWGFKHIFGKKEFMLDFLNSLLQGERVITDIRYMNNERKPEQKEMKKVLNSKKIKEMIDRQEDFAKNKQNKLREREKEINEKLNQECIFMPNGINTSSRTPNDFFIFIFFI